MKYTYELHPVEKPKNAVYSYNELIHLTTLQLREICRNERLVIGVAYKLDRNYMIQTILKYRGERLLPYIENFIEESTQNLFEKLGAYIHFSEDNRYISIPAKISLYKDTDITIEDNYTVNANQLNCGSLLLLDDKRNICAILSIKEHNSNFYIVNSHKLLKSNMQPAIYKNYSLGFLDENSSRNLYNYYYGQDNLRPFRINCVIKKITELHIISVEDANTTLVIDFGTSNSSAGFYMEGRNEKLNVDKKGICLNEINKLKFRNGLEKITTISELLPTVIAIQNCSDVSNICYRFGYDALQYVKEHNYTNIQSVFYNMKRWINNYDKQEEVIDEMGNTVSISRKDMIRAYFKYIITIGEQQYKCRFRNIHITSPVKQKYQFLAMYQDILEGYHVAVETALDEGVAVLYNSISNQIENHNFYENQEYQALIIDCGGGTTDLTSCSYYIENNQITYKMDLTTTYVNGESYFGGNNITFRIFQYLKIIFSYYYSNKDRIIIEDLFDSEMCDIYNFVDSIGFEKVYEKLEQYYEQCENIIPTKYNEYKQGNSEDFIKVRSNFYFLWNLAEKMKVDFYQSVGISHTHFHERGIKIDKIKIVAEESWRINVFQHTISGKNNQLAKKENIELVLRTDYPQLIITKEEINMLIKADIYNVIKKFIEPFYIDDKLGDFNFIKLTGQTCKIDLFRDALKEFIPGKLIAASKKEKSVQDFKLICLEGAIKYENAKKIGLIAPSVTNKAPITPYKLIAYTHTNTEVTMMSSFENINKSYGFVSRNIDTEEVELMLYGTEGKSIHKYLIYTNIEDFRTTTYEETSNEYSDKILQADIDSIMDDEIKIFTFAFEDRWGFYVLPLARKNKMLYIGEKKYYPFENDEWEINFFDGMK